MNREQWELSSPRRELEQGVADYLEEIVSTIATPSEFILPSQDEWPVPVSRLSDNEVENIAGEAGFHIESNGNGFIYYPN